MTTQAVSYTVPSDGWTGTLDVTDAELSATVSTKDFKIFYDGVEQGTSELANWAKTSQVLLTYSGSSLNTGDVVLLRRNTPKDVIEQVSANSVILSSLWNNEFARITRWQEERDIFYSGATATAGVSNEAFGSGWNGVTEQAPSKDAVYNLFVFTNTVAGDWTFTGDTTLVGDVTFSGSPTVSGSATLSGALTLSGDNTHSGTTTFTGTTSSLTPVITTEDTTVATTSFTHSLIDNLLRNVFQARLTLSSSDNTTPTGSSTSVYLHPYNGNLVSLYNGTTWDIHEMSTYVTLALGTVVADTPYDVFLYDNSGTLTLEKVAWTDASNRATALTTQDGIYVKTGETGKRYVGTIVPHNTTEVLVDTSINQSYFGGYNDVPGWCGISNYYNPLPFTVLKYDRVSSYTTTLQNGGYFVTASYGLVFGNNAPDWSVFKFASCMLGQNASYHLSINGSASSYSKEVQVHRSTTVARADSDVLGMCMSGFGYSALGYSVTGKADKGLNTWAAGAGSTNTSTLYSMGHVILETLY